MNVVFGCESVDSLFEVIYAAICYFFKKKHKELKNHFEMIFTM